MSKEKEIVKEKDGVKETTPKRSKAFTVIGIILCVILLPILIINVTMIIKSYTSPDEYPSFAGYTMMIVLSPSMEDTIMTGDLIMVKLDEPENVEGESSTGAQDGTIISFFDPDSDKQTVLTHRCVEVTTDKDGDTAFRTKGDNNASDDLSLCPAENLIGTYVTRIPGAGNVAMWLQTTPGLIVCIAVPIVLLVAYDLIMKKRYDKSKKKDTDALLAELEELRAQQSADEEKAEAKAEESDKKAVEAKAEEKPAEKEKAPEESSDKEDKAEEAEKPEESKESEKAEEKPVQAEATAPAMTAEELAEFREFQKMTAQKESANQEKSDEASSKEDESSEE